MTRAELAQLQNRREWEAERASLMERALAYARGKRAEEAAKIQSIRIMDAENFNRTPIVPAREDDRFHYEQRKASRHARLYDHDGQRKPLAELSLAYGRSEGMVRQRLGRGWTLAEALTIEPRAKAVFPKGSLPATYEHAGKRQTLLDWGNETGIDPRAIRKRLAKGWTLARALAPTAKPNRKSDPKPKNVRSIGGPEPKTYECDGVTKTIRQWTAEFDLPEASIRKCLKDGLSMKEAIDHCRRNRCPGRGRRGARRLGVADQLLARNGLTGGSPSTHAQL